MPAITQFLLTAVLTGVPIGLVACGLTSEVSSFADPRLELLWAEVEATETHLAQVLRNYGAAAFYNEGRKSVQVLCSAGLVIESVPLSPEQVALIAKQDITP